MIERGNRTGRSGKNWWVVGALIATVGCESSSTLQIRNGEVETAEFKVPIPNGHRPMSRSEMSEKTKKHPPAENVVLFLENPGVGGITILRQNVRSKGGVAPAAPTIEECGRFLAKVTAHRGDPVVVGATLVEYPQSGLGGACKFSVASSPTHMTQISNTEWSIVCGHLAGESAPCEQVAAGFRRR